MHFHTLGIFHTPHFPYSSFSTLRTPRFPSNQTTTLNHYLLGWMENEEFEVWKMRSIASLNTTKTHQNGFEIAPEANRQ